MGTTMVQKPPKLNFITPWYTFEENKT